MHQIREKDAKSCSKNAVFTRLSEHVKFPGNIRAKPNGEICEQKSKNGERSLNSTICSRKMWRSKGKKRQRERTESDAEENKRMTHRRKLKQQQQVNGQPYGKEGFHEHERNKIKSG